jgi:hypothetical protein
LSSCVLALRRQWVHQAGARTAWLIGDVRIGTVARSVGDAVEQPSSRPKLIREAACYFRRGPNAASASCEARVGYQTKEVHCLVRTAPPLASIDPQIAFANEVVAAMKNRLTEDRAMAGMRQGELSWRR